MRHRLAGPAMALTLILLAAACGDDDGVDIGGDGNGNGDGVEATGQLVAAIGGEPDQLDPHQTTAYPSFQVLENVYDTLVVPAADDLSFEPSLATEWETSDDDLTWTFTLRDDVTFHDGSTFDAADVVYSFERIIDEELANAFRFGNVTSVTAVDDTTVELELSQPTPNLLANVGGFKGMAILPEGAAEELDLATEANGTGPFRLAGQSPGSITLEAFDDYWGDGPGVAEVEIRFISEATTALTSLQTEEVHWTDNVPAERISDLESAGIEVGQVPSVDYWYMATNFGREPFSDPAVREAIAYALDREAIAEVAQAGLASVNQTAIPEDSFWHHDYAPYEHDVERAQQLLTDAGVTEVSMGLMVTNEFPQTVDAAQVIAANLADVGIDVDVQVEEFATWLDRQGEGDFDAFMLGWLGNLDPFGYYHSQHVCEGSNNYHGYCDEETDALLNDASTETDEDERRDLYHQAVERIVDANSYIYLYNPDVVQAWVDELEGYEIRADRAINFETVTLG